MSGGGFPTLVALRSKLTNKHVSPGRAGGSLGATGDSVLSPQCKFELERAKTPGKEHLFSIRCCWNNRYWVKESAISDNIKAVATEPNEDTSSWSCTLVDPAFVDNGTAITLRLAQTRNHIGTSSVSPGHALHEARQPGSPDVVKFLIINSQSLVTFPKEVCFHGKATDKYLATRMLDYPAGGKKPFLKFDATDIGHQSVVQEVIQNGDGSVMIKSKEHGYFWMAGARNWIVAVTESPIPDHLRDYCTFIPVKADDNTGTIALRNKGHNLFCTTLYSGHLDGCLNSNLPGITRDAEMSVQEAVLSRRIYNVRYRLGDARIHDETVLVMATAETTNHTSQTQTTNLKFKRTETHTTTFERSLFSSLTVQNTITAGFLKIVEAKIEITATVELSFKWGEELKTETEIETSTDAPVPPRTRVVMSLVATKGHCDVPYSYTVHDRLRDGRDLIYEMDDGVYNGANPYTFQYLSEEFPLPPN